MNTWLSFALTPLLFISAFIGCSQEENSTGPKIEKTFEVTGVLVRVENEGRTLVIKHEEIPDYMGAMMMPFRVKNVSESSKASPGDEIRFTYNVAELESWIEDIEPTGKQEELEQVAPNPTLSSKRLKVGEKFPSFKLLDEHGSEVQLTDYRGKAVALTFIFTRCPVPEYCPAMMRNFSEVEKLLGANAVAAKNYKLLTVSFDSDYDTPETLKAYGEKFGQTSKQWSLLSSPKTEDIRPLAESVGLMFGKSDNAIYSHNLRTVVLDKEGRITKIFTDESWKPEELVKEIIEANRGE